MKRKYYWYRPQPLSHIAPDCDLTRQAAEYRAWFASTHPVTPDSFFAEERHHRARSLEIARKRYATIEQRIAATPSGYARQKLRAELGLLRKATRPNVRFSWRPSQERFNIGKTATTQLHEAIDDLDDAKSIAESARAAYLDSLIEAQRATTPEVTVVTDSGFVAEYATRTGLRKTLAGELLAAMEVI